jgi:uncharacterized membrane protein YidH (DUF202 family)
LYRSRQHELNQRLTIRFLIKAYAINLSSSLALDEQKSNNYVIGTLQRSLFIISIAYCRYAFTRRTSASGTDRRSTIARRRTTASRSTSRSAIIVVAIALVVVIVPVFALCVVCPLSFV